MLKSLRVFENLFLKVIKMKKIVAATLLAVTSVFGGSLFDEAFKAHQSGDYHKAAELYKKACDSGYVVSCLDLARLYEDGKGVRQDYHEAKELYGKACDLGDQLGCDKYAKLNQEGY